ncbi:hypothetical protein [Phenylobacterium sp.]|uniref:hypothetical protein n=1 Tax=Phenylobacterium sp. TaxID=1871053 RepID=UPI0025CD8EF6|nr:hypothetical protein [Phenylobacterium sp.]
MTASLFTPHVLFGAVALYDAILVAVVLWTVLHGEWSLEPFWFKWSHLNQIKRL